MQEKHWHKKCFYRVSIKAVIANENGEVLFVREKNNSNWNLPGGGMDYGETEHDALRRELAEEVGLSGGFLEAKPLGLFPKYLEDKQAWQLWVVYKIVPEIFEFCAGPEANEIAFLDPADFKETHPHVFEFCNQAKD